MDTPTASGEIELKDVGCGDFIFDEEYEENDHDSDSEFGHSESEQEGMRRRESEMDQFSHQLGITIEQADANLESAGQYVDEEGERITVAGNMDLMDDDADILLNEIVRDLQLPYKLAEFQRVSVNALAQKKNVILVSPTGSGKMSIPLLATLVLRKKLGISKGVCIVTQPLSSIMNEKMKKNGIA